MKLPDELLQNAGSTLAYAAAILIGVLSSMMKSRLDKKPKNSVLLKTMNTEIKLRELISEVRAILNSDRVCLYQFKNGAYFAGGQSDQKLFLSHFVTAPGIAPPAISVVNPPQIPIGYVISHIKEVRDRGQVSWKRADLSANDSFIISQWAVDGTIFAVAYALTNPKGDYLGMVSASWVDVDEAVEENNIRVKELVRRIGIQVST